MNLKTKLIFIPHAGGSCLSYSRLIKEVPHDIDLQILDLPGRNQFYRDPWPISWAELISSLYQRLEPNNVRMIIMGHSFGALVALELAAFCTQKGHEVVLGISGMNAPVSEYWSQQKKISRLPEIEFIEHLKIFSEVPDSVPVQFLQLIKADFAMMENFSIPSKRAIPALVFGGSLDPLTTYSGLEAWERLVDLKRSPQIYPGNHFQFFLNHIGLIIKELLIFV